MATLIPAFTSCAGKMTAGERRFARRLEEKLDDALLWYDVPIGPKKLHPDLCCASSVAWPVRARGQRLEVREYSERDHTPP